MSDWVVDKAITKLFDQINAAAPNRSKKSDGTFGDPAHQAQGAASQHNPEHPAPAGNPDYQVDAGDYTHDPAHGADMAIVSESIRESKDARVLYVIFNRREFSGPEGPDPFVWRDYDGDDPHTNHMHVSVRDVTHDQTQDWEIGIDMSAQELVNTFWATPVPGTNTTDHPKDRTAAQLIDDFQLRTQALLVAVENTNKVMTDLLTLLKDEHEEVPDGGTPGA